MPAKIDKRRKAKTKTHITATIDPDLNTAITNYRNAAKNRIKGEKPTRSGIIQDALKGMLVEYMPA